ncbi:hypothetical protein ACFL58_01375 [Elusimicrobiota bacterium]
MDSIYGLGVFGAAVYFILRASGFWMAMLGILKAIVWPAFMVYSLFEVLQKKEVKDSAKKGNKKRR